MIKSGMSLGTHWALSFSVIIAFMAFLAILSTTREQSAGNERVNESIIQMGEVTQQNAAMVEVAATAAQTLHSEADNLSNAISVFKLGDDGDSQLANTVHAIGHEAPSVSLGQPTA